VTDKPEATSRAGIVAEKIRTHLAEPYVPPVKREGESAAMVTHRCTVAVGVVVFGNHETSREDILKWADAATYQAKDAGRNAVQFYSARSQP
jgi:diguanylate cyclase (GGDEF)-like protein